jgi:hypothetical protein
MLHDFETFDADRCSLEQLVTLAAFGRGLRAEHEALGIEEPEWVGSQLKAVRREVAARNADSIEKRIREKKSRLEALKPPEEKRAALQAEIDALEAKRQKV